ncbi:MAG TPA: glycosyltransferase N-terminal domain-containing protein, partial [Bacteroidales bacterium]|nr:glycosyltransferase N-terminal domain-containing protein [Bacteroidales bacterium]
MYIFIVLYTIVYCLLYIPLFCFAALWNKKIREGLLGRIYQIKNIPSIVTASNNKKVILIHSASVGEWEQSIPIIKQLKQNHTDLYIIATFFSPSGMRHAKKTDIDAALYLPFDVVFTAYFFLNKIRPAVWIISKYDVWPGFVCAAHMRNIPILLCSAELAQDSTRHKGILAYINKLFYSHIHTIFPVSEEYKQHFMRIFPFPERLIVAGDARYDQIIQKAEQIQSQPAIQLFAHKKQVTFIAGSIWPADEKHLLPAIIKIFKQRNDLQLILVPHELHENHIAAIQKELLQANIVSERYTEFSKKETDCTTCDVAIIDTIGMLAKIYHISDVAYVGGAFSTGVHNVAEPAIL